MTGKIKTLFSLVLSVLIVSLSLCGCSLMSLGAESSQPLESQSVAPPSESAQPIASQPATPEPTATPSPEEIMEAAVNRIMSEMTIEEKIGQMFITRCPDTGAVEAITQYNIGNYILFDRDFTDKTMDEVVDTIASYQAAAKIPMLIGVDEEGGTVVRVSDKPNLCDEQYDSPRNLFADGGIDEILAVEQDKINLLKSLGINANFAPVADISVDPEDFIYYRSLGQDADTTADFIKRTVELYAENQMGCIMKHFPGYGNNEDTHTGIAYDERSWEQITGNDIVPFMTGSTVGFPGVLVSHNIIDNFDPADPASLSKPIHDYMRNDMGFNGPVITDDLYMDAIRDFTESDTSSVAAIKAGNDILCCTDYQDQIPSAIAAYENGDITEERINESVHRILVWKYKLGLVA